MIRLRHCVVEWIAPGARTTFADGASVEGHHHPDDPHYRVISHRCGYGDDTLAYAREHELLHSLGQELLHGRPSPVLWELAHGREPGPSADEEIFTQALQRWLRASERPIIAGVPWDGWRARAMALLAANERD